MRIKLLLLLLSFLPFLSNAIIITKACQSECWSNADEETQAMMAYFPKQTAFYFDCRPCVELEGGCTYGTVVSHDKASYYNNNTAVVYYYSTFIKLFLLHMFF